MGNHGKYPVFVKLFFKNLMAPAEVGVIFIPLTEEETEALVKPVQE